MEKGQASLQIRTGNGEFVRTHGQRTRRYKKRLKRYAVAKANKASGNSVVKRRFEGQMAAV